ncbi:MAG: RDD family protein [Bacilli bacterium]|nr:RDD family protein [Bacilli bacterium]
MQKGCPKCGRMIDSQYEICPNCKYDFKEIDSFFKNVEEKKYSEEQKYGGFIKRLIAGLIDIDIMAIIWYMISFYLKGNILLPSVVITIIYILSNAILERSSWRGSLGKKILELEVTDEYENPITFPKAIVRNTCKIANVLTLGIGFLTCVAPPYKQTLGDRLSGTLVLNKQKFHEEKHIDTAPIYKRALAFIIDIIVIVLLILGKNEIIKYMANNNIYKVTEEINNLITVIIALAYFPINEGERGETVGKRIIKIQLVNLNDKKITYVKAFIRMLLIITDIFTFGFLLPLGSNKNQTLKDMITKTVVINH